MGERVRIEQEGSVATVRLTRPEKHNGMDFAMLREVVDAQRTLRKQRDVRVVILRGDGPSFCAGLDFKSAFEKPLRAAVMASQLFWPVRNVFQRWSVGFRELGACVIACVHGNCFGAGLQLALGADIRITTPDAKLSVMESKWGLVPDMGGAALLRELVPIDVAKELTFTGRVLTGEEAHALGLVTHVRVDPYAHAIELAREIEARSPDAVAAGKFLLQEAYDGGEEHALAAERRWQRRLMGRANQRIAAQRNRQSDKDRASEVPFVARRIGV
jgi:enoyl-CoA hydratase/carnithine racemase